MMCGAEMQWCCKSSYTKCSYVLSMMSHAPALAVSLAALSSASLLSRTPGNQYNSIVGENPAAKTPLNTAMSAPT